MASSGKKKTTMAKLMRETKLREKRLDKQAKKEARKLAPPEAFDEGADALAPSPDEDAPSAPTHLRSSASATRSRATDLLRDVQRPGPARPRSIRLSAVSAIESSTGRGCQPSIVFAFSAVYVAYSPRSLTIERTLGSNSPIAGSAGWAPRASEPCRRRRPRRSRRICPTSLHPQEAVDRQEALAAGGSAAVIARMCRSATSRTSTNTKPSRGIAGMPLSSRSITCSEYERSSLSTGPMIAPGLTVVSRSSAPRDSDVIPGGALGDRLRAHIGRASQVVGIGPVALVVGRVGRRRAPVAHRGDRRSHHDALHARVEARLQHAQRSVARRHDQLVCILRLRRRERRCDVQHVVAPRYRVGPAVVGVEIGREDRQPLAGVHACTGDRRPHIVGSLQVAHGRANGVAAAQQLDRAPPAEESRSPGDQHRPPRLSHRRQSSPVPPSSAVTDVPAAPLGRDSELLPIVV